MLIQRLKNYPIGILASEFKNFLINTPREMTKLERRFISCKPKQESRGNVLLCYVNQPFFLKHGEPVPIDHTNKWESLQIAQTFLDLNYRVDIINENNDYFVPSKNYAFFVGNRTNFRRIASLLNKECIRILHIDTAHWLFHNTAECRRLLELQKRRGFILIPRRHMSPNQAIEHADYATVLGNAFTLSTYSYAAKPLYRVPISAPVQYPWQEAKDFSRVRKKFLWLGSGGFVHKGLDLVLEAFAEMADYDLTVCGPIDQEEDFKRAYHKELYETPNIHTVGWADIDSPRFVDITSECVGLIYPSGSEGQCGAVVTGLHAGLIPVISYESGVDVNDFGVILRSCSIEEIKNSIRMVSGLASEKLRLMARGAWEYARGNHTRARFAEEYRKAISTAIEASVSIRRTI